MEQFPSAKANTVLIQLLKTLPAIYGIRTFVTMFTRARHWTLNHTNPAHTLKPNLLT
jgi:hypothetical protein